MAFPWVPIGTALQSGISGRVLEEGETWQVIATSGPAAVLLRPPPAGPPWWEAEIKTLSQELLPVACEGLGGPLVALAWPKGIEAPRSFTSLSRRPRALDAGEAADAFRALAELSARQPRADWGSALYLCGTGTALGCREGQVDRRGLAVALLSGGVADAAMAPAQIRSLNPQLTIGEVADLLAMVGFKAATPRPTQVSVRWPDEFVLPGQPVIERAFRETILHPLAAPERYERLGVALPNGILLAGPPGTGKSHAVRKLAAFLGWPVFDLDAASLGSAFIHETARRTHEAFSKAAAAAPAIVLFEEIDALGGDRAGSASYRVEEVTQLLRGIESAAARGVLVLATTNRLAEIDPALRRRGRFDLVIEVQPPDAAAAEAALRAALEGRPLDPAADLAQLARGLAGRPFSDLAWLVNEAARRAARASKERIDAIDLAGAARALRER
jgi:hypothetical protein